MSTENGDPRLQVARRALEQELAKTDVPAHLNWYESTRTSDATVLAFDVIASERGQSEKLVGIAIRDSQTLFLATWSGGDWVKVTNPS